MTINIISTKYIPLVNNTCYEGELGTTNTVLKGNKLRVNYLVASPEQRGKEISEYYMEQE